MEEVIKKLYITVEIKNLSRDKVYEIQDLNNLDIYYIKKRNKKLPQE